MRLLLTATLLAASLAPARAECVPAPEVSCAFIRRMVALYGREGAVNLASQYGYCVTDEQRRRATACLRTPEDVLRVRR